jgi:hypothetical protein
MKKLSNKRIHELAMKLLYEPSSFPHVPWPALDRKLAVPHRGIPSLELANERWRLIEGGKVTLDVAATRETTLVITRLFEALLTEQILVKYLKAAMLRPSKYEVQRPSRIADIVREVAANLPQSHIDSEAKLVERLHKDSIREIERRCRTDQELNEVVRNKQLPVSKRYVRKLLADGLTNGNRPLKASAKRFVARKK